MGAGILGTVPVADQAMWSDAVDRVEWLMRGRLERRLEMQRIRRVAFASFSKQLLALCDDRTPHCIVELARDWQAEGDI